jgi:subtilase family serine protease
MSLRTKICTTLAACSFVAILITAPTYAAEKAAITGRLAATQQVQFDVYLPLENRAELDALVTSLNDSKSANYHKWLTPAQFHQQFGTSATRLAAVRHELEAHGLTTTQVTSQKFHVSGSTRAVEQMFATQLRRGVYRNGHSAIVPAGGMSLPSALATNGAVVTGLSGYVRMRPHSRRLAAPLAVDPQNRSSNTGGYWFNDLKQAYRYPSYQALNGKGVTIGVLMANDFNRDDMTSYFGHEKVDVPNMTTVNVDGGAPFDPDLSFETHLDLQQAGGMAPQANLILYNLPDLTDQSIVDGLVTILEANQADVVNMSFGGPELSYTRDYNNGQDFTALLGLYDDLFRQGNAQGITFVASSGDLGALSVPSVACLDPSATSSCGQFQASAEIPASSPHVTGVGGTNLVTTFAPGSLESAYVSENAHSDPLSEDIFYGTPATGGVWGSGGGISIYFRKPGYQFLVDNGSKRMRTVPDVSLQMGGCPGGSVQPCGPERSYTLLAMNGKYYGVVGTSVSSPDFAGLLALKIQLTGSRLGNENWVAYGIALLQSQGVLEGVFNDNIQGDNGTYTTHPGYDLVLGNGTVNGVNYLLAPSIPVAGTPQTPSNP